jgi:hypothetical protein
MTRDFPNEAVPSRSTNKAFSKGKIPPVPHPCGDNSQGEFLTPVNKPITPQRHPKPAAIRAMMIHLQPGSMRYHLY